MIIDFDAYLKNDDIQIFADFVRKSLEKEPRDFNWLINLECAHHFFRQERHLAPGKPSIKVFSPLINDALRFGGDKNAYYQRSVCNVVAGWTGESRDFSEQDAVGIFETLEYLHRNENEKSIDTGKIFTKRIEVVSNIYHFSLPSRWSAFDFHVLFALETVVIDFWKVHPDIFSRLGDLLHFSDPLTSAEHWENESGSKNVERIAENFVRTSLLLRCIADNLNEHDVTGGGNYLSPSRGWEVSPVWMALFHWGRNRKPEDKPQGEPINLKGRLTDME
jgi:hypothetical protein